MNTGQWSSEFLPIYYSNFAPPPPPPMVEQAEVVLERAHLFSTLRDLGGAMTHDPHDIRVIKPAGDFRPTFVGIQGAADRTDLRHDEAPLTRSLYAN